MDLEYYKLSLALQERDINKLNRIADRNYYTRWKKIKWKIK